MTGELKISVGQHSDKGRKDANQDFHGILISQQPLLSAKGIAIALADGISSSEFGHIASESAVKGFLTDYFCTSDSWSVQHSAQRVLEATNSWLYAQTLRSNHQFDKDRGYVTTLSAMVLKSATAHIFHVGDCRIYRVLANSLEQLTNDHRVIISPEQSYLARALGINPQLEIDYQAVPLQIGDLFLLVTDGVHEYVADSFVLRTIADHAGDLDLAARLIVQHAYDQGSPDNLTVQLVRIEQLPDGEPFELLRLLSDLAPAPLLEERQELDGYEIVRELHASSRSHVYLAVDRTDGQQVVLKTPSIEMGGDPSYLQRFMMEEWVARRIHSNHVVKPCPPVPNRSFLYLASEYIDGQSLAQWMRDNKRPPLETVRGIVEQIASGLQAFHRMEMLHQDLRPENVMIDLDGTVKIIDFGSTRVAGVAEMAPPTQGDDLLGTLQYSAPEYFIGEDGTPQSDIFSLGVIAYQMLTGRLPYGAEVSRARSRMAQRKLKYRSALQDDQQIPVWIDRVLQKAVHPDPLRRYALLSEFTYDLRHPGQQEAQPRPLLERNPLRFWQVLCLILTVAVAGLLWVIGRT